MDETPSVSIDRFGIDGFTDDLRTVAPQFTGRSPVYERLCRLLADLLERDAALAARFAHAWGGDSPYRFHAVYGRPLLALASMRFDALSDLLHPLAKAIARRDPEVEAATPDALAAALAPERTLTWEAIAHRHVQTNETSRAVTWMWPAFLAGADEGARPIALADLGCSAGLNLTADLLPAPWRDETGARVPVVRGPRVLARRGFDRQPLDADSPDHQQWLRACLWPGETAREERLDAAFVAFEGTRARGRDLRLEVCDAEEMPARVMALSKSLPDDTLVLAYETAMRDYLPAPIAARMDDGMRAWIDERGPGRAAWLELSTLRAGEAPYPAQIVAHLADGTGTRDLVLARTAHHPQTLTIQRAAVAELERILRATAR